MGSYALGLPFPLGGDAAPGLVVYPMSASAGDTVQVSAGLTNILNTSRDDAFTSVTIDSSKWVETSIGSLTSLVGGHLRVSQPAQLASGSIYRLTSASTYAAVNPIFEFGIVNNPNVDSTYTATEIVYGKLSVFENGGAGVVASIERVRTIAGTQAVRMVLYKPGVGNVVYSMLPDDSTACKLQIIRSAAGHFRWVYNDVILTTVMLETGSTLSVSIEVTASDNKSNIDIEFKSYLARAVVTIGSQLASVAYESFDRITAIVPNVAPGFSSVILSDMYGVVGEQPSFSVVGTNGVVLSRNNGVNGTVQNDPVLR